MLRIAIVEDDDIYTQQLQQYLEQYGRESGHAFEVTCYTDGDEIVAKYKSQYDIILLDVQMQFMDGVTTAEEIRRVDSEVVIIFITNMTQYAVKGYAVDALDYVLKPVSYYAFSQRLDRAITRMKNRTRNFVAVAVKGGVQKLDIAQIHYVESQDHKLIFATGNGELASSGTMKEMEEKLQPYGFFRCNKGILVNLEHVDGVQDGCALVGGKQLLISRARKSEFMAALANYLGGVVK